MRKGATSLKALVLNMNAAAILNGLLLLPASFWQEVPRAFLENIVVNAALIREFKLVFPSIYFTGNKLNLITHVATYVLHS